MGKTRFFPKRFREAVGPPATDPELRSVSRQPSLDSDMELEPVLTNPEEFPKTPQVDMYPEDFAPGLYHSNVCLTVSRSADPNSEFLNDIERRSIVEITEVRILEDCQRVR